MIVAKGPWHRWFAWRPVWAPAFGWGWLRTIERRFVRERVDAGPLWFAAWDRPQYRRAP